MGCLFCLCCKTEVKEEKKDLAERRLKARKNKSKVVLLGQSKVGKSAIIHYAIHKEFLSEYVQTVGGKPSYTNIVAKGNLTWKLAFNEIAGSPDMQGDLKDCNNDGDAYLIIYDINNSDSLKKAEEELIYTNKIASTKKLLYLIANKIDECTSLEIHEKIGKAKAKEHGAIFKMTSAKEGDTIPELIQEMVDTLSSKQTMICFPI